MAEDRSIKVRLGAEFGDLTKQLDDAAKKTDILGQKLEASSRKVETARTRQRAAAEQVAAAERRLQEVQQRSNATEQQKKQASQEVANARRAEKAATESLTRAEQDHAKLANQATTSTGRLAQAAQENADQWQRAGTVLLSAGAAITGIGVAAIKAGISYNSLQQKSRAAMTTLLGSAEAANEQMDKLDTFAKTSPFSKQTFITAQQQMLAFGVETSKVIPYLDALNDTTAAAGGNAQTLGELAFIMAQISAAGKITGQDLIQFGQRGVNAAEMIGLSMGKTGAEIRAEITAGTLDANDALDALAAGMKKTNNGAAANVKTTWEGALDRVGAAWRDLGAQLAEPLVGKEGGGILVDLANAAADATRSFMGLPAPIKDAIAVTAALSGGVLLLAGGYLTLAPRIIKTTAALKANHAQMSATSKTYSTVAKGAKLAAKALGGLAAVATAISFAPTDAVKQTNEMLDLLEQVGQKSVDVNAMLSGIDSSLPLSSGPGEFREVLKSIADPSFMDSINNGLSKIATGIGGLFGADWRGAFDKQMDQLKAYGPQLASLADSDLPAATSAFNAMYEAAGGNAKAYDDLMAALPDYRDAIVGVARENNLATDDVTLLRIATGKLEVQSKNSAEALDEGGSAAERYADALAQGRDTSKDYAEALKDQLELQQEAAGIKLAARDAERNYQDALDAARDSLKENGKTLNTHTEEGRANQAALDAIADAGWKRIDALREEGASEEKLRKKMRETRENYIKTAQSMGQSREEAKKLADQLGLIPRNVRVKVDADTAEAASWIDKFIRDNSGRSIVVRVNTATNSTSLTTGRRNQIGKADGGLVHFADGTENHIAQIAKPGDWRVWAEPETGGEAYIPLSPAKRPRSKAILTEVANRFGMSVYADGAVVSAKADRDKAKREAKAAADAQKSAQKAYDNIDSGNENRGKKKAAKVELDRAKAEAKRAQERLKRAEDALKLERERRSRRQDFASEFATANRRGEGVRAQVNDGSGLSVVDEMLSWADSGAFSKARNKKLRTAAKSAEKKLVSAYSRLEDANETFNNLASLYDNVRSGLAGGWGLSGLLGSTNAFGFTTTGSGKDIAKSAQAYAGKLKSLGGKLSQLRKAGASQALIEKIVELDTDEALQVADAFLADPGSASATSKALSAIDANANSVGLQVANGAAGAASAGLYIARGGELGSAAIDAISANIDSIGKSLAKAFQSAIDGKTPAKSAAKTTKKTAKKKAGKRASGGVTVMGQPYLVGEEGPELFVPGVTGTIVPSRLTIPAVQAASSAATTTVQQIDYTQLARAFAQEVSHLPVQTDLLAGTKFQTEVVRRGLSELARSGDPILEKVRSR